MIGIRVSGGAELVDLMVDGRHKSVEFTKKYLKSSNTIITVAKSLDRTSKYTAAPKFKPCYVHDIQGIMAVRVNIVGNPGGKIYICWMQLLLPLLDWG
jgi:hypothetical protein